MFDVVSIGNATQDVFIEIPGKKNKGCIILPCGSKQEAKSIFYATGGGATNSAVSFSRLGLKTGILAALGKDETAETILKELKREKIDVSLIVKLPKFNTAYSAIVTGKGYDRIIFTYGGATTHLKKESHINWRKLGKAKWFYVSSFHSKASLLRKIFSFAKKKGVKIAWTPGKSEIAQGLKKLGPLLKKADLVFLNGEEAKLLTKKKGAVDMLKALQKFGPTTVITLGSKGSKAFDGEKIYTEKTRKIRVKDSTGAGDAFNSGFLTAIIRGKGIGKALTLGTRNAEAVLVEMGAKNNLLTKKRAKKYT
ncbi:MAG: carbohydrate kinase family protein [archaeon]|nr:carbohydrate kinase family protein [archaeon]